MAGHGVKAVQPEQVAVAAQAGGRFLSAVVQLIERAVFRLLQRAQHGLLTGYVLRVCRCCVDCWLKAASLVTTRLYGAPPPVIHT